MNKLEVTDELRDKAIEILKEEGTYKDFIKFVKRGKQNKAMKIMLDVIERHDLNKGDILK